MKFISPLKVLATKARKFILNLNIFRNTHYRVLNNWKINYKNYMEEQIEASPRYKKVFCIYTIYPMSKRKFDLGNVCCIHQKFFEDALVELGKLEDDNVDFIPLVIYKKGEIDKNNPRVEVDVYDITNSNKEVLLDIIEDVFRKESIDND